MISPVRLAIKTNIPAKSSGRLVDALTDVIRPLTERMGLKADLIRLQREEVALKVAQLAMERIRIEKKPITPVPTKTITRLLEAASLEDPHDDAMIQLWANLLASSAISAEGNIPRHISILSDINGQQANLIQQIFTRQNRIRKLHDADLLKDDLWSMDQAGVLEELRHEQKKLSPVVISKVVRDHLSQPGVALSDVIIVRGRDQWDSPQGLFPVDKHQSDFDILESLSLVHNRAFKNAVIGDFEISVFFYCVSHLCVDMFAACNPRIVRRRDSDQPVPKSHQLATRNRVDPRKPLKP